MFIDLTEINAEMQAEALKPPEAEQISFVINNESVLKEMHKVKYLINERVSSSNNSANSRAEYKSSIYSGYSIGQVQKEVRKSEYEVTEEYIESIGAKKEKKPDVFKLAKNHEKQRKDSNKKSNNKYVNAAKIAATKAVMHTLIKSTDGYKERRKELENTKGYKIDNGSHYKNLKAAFRESLQENNISRSSRFR